MTQAPSIRDIIDFCFLPLGHPDHGKPRDIWWRSTPEFDAETVGRFGAAIERAAAANDASVRAALRAATLRYAKLEAS